MKFCSNCGKAVLKEVPPGDNRPRYVCKFCPMIHYQNPRVIVGVLPTYDNSILLCERDIQPRKGFWTLPAGFLENGESTLDGAIRECKEESLATVSDATLYAIYDIPHIEQVYIFYRARMEKPYFAKTTESSDVQLFTEEDIPWEQLAFPVVAEMLTSFINDRKCGQFDVKYKQINKCWKRPKAAHNHA